MWVDTCVCQQWPWEPAAATPPPRTGLPHARACVHRWLRISVLLPPGWSASCQPWVPGRNFWKSSLFLGICRMGCSPGARSSLVPVRVQGSRVLGSGDLRLAPAQGSACHVALTWHPPRPPPLLSSAPSGEEKSPLGLLPHAGRWPWCGGWHRWLWVVTLWAQPLALAPSSLTALHLECTEPSAPHHGGHARLQQKERNSELP